VVTATFAISDDGVMTSPSSGSSSYEPGQAWVPGDEAPNFADGNPDPYHGPEGDRGGPVVSRKLAVMLASSTVSALLLAVALLLPPQVVVFQAGPTYDVLGADAGPLLTVEGAPQFGSEGELRITTVGIFDLADDAGTLGEAIQAWLDPHRGVAPTDAIFGTAPEEETIAAQDFLTSQEVAAVSALELLDYEVPMTLTVVDFFEESEANGVLEVGDIITGIDGTPVISFSDLSAALADRTPGDQVRLEVNRAGDTIERQIRTIAGPADEAIMGIWVDPDFDLPVDVDVAIDSVGGPSAGMMFALAIADTLTEIDEGGDAHVAGSGTITIDGEVGPIGGIEFKMIGSVRDGAQWFLAPVANCPEVVGNIPDGLSVVAVETLEEAYAALIAIGEGATGALPSCN